MRSPQNQSLNISKKEHCDVFLRKISALITPRQQDYHALPRKLKPNYFNRNLFSDLLYLKTNQIFQNSTAREDATILLNTSVQSVKIRATV